MAWLTLVFGGIVLVVGLIGQIFFIRRGKRTTSAHPHDKRTAKIVVTVGSTVVGLWLVFFSVAHLMHLHTVGHW